VTYLPGVGWRLQAQTNPINVGLRTNWVDVSGGGSTNQYILPMGATDGSVFFRLIYPQLNLNLIIFQSKSTIKTKIKNAY
jgi:hypothetical protein